MVPLIGRIPFQLSHGQAVLVLGLLVAFGIAGLTLLIFDGLIERVVGGLLRLTGHQPPTKTPFRVALDAWEEESRRSKQPPPD